MGMEDILVHLITENEAALEFVDRRNAMNLAVMERTLEMYRGKIDFMWVGEDLGTQNTPMISLDLFRKIFRPRHQKFIDLAKAYNLPVMIHTCGSSSWAYEDFIEMGMTGVDTLQPEATNMSPAYLKEHFGGRLSFRGCISTAGPLAYGTAQETEANVKDTLEIMMKGYGYHFAATHAIQDNSPTENVIAMYNAAHKYGVY
jgi:uroporphyrinogen decarboxylase